MIQKINELEQIAKQLEPTPSKRNNWNQQLLNYTNDFIDQIPHRKSYHIENNPVKEVPAFYIKDEPTQFEELLSIIQKEVDTPGLNPASGGHLAYIPGGGLMPSAMGDYLVAITNRYAGISFGSPGAVRLENHLIRWMCEMIGFPDTALGNLTSGGSIANLIAVCTARDAKGLKAAQFEKSVIYLTEQVHHSIQKAIRIAGLTEAKINYVPVDERFRMDTDALKAAIEEDRHKGLNPFLLVASAGTTDTGAIDPLNALADVAEENDLWYHVDGAYGGFFILVEEIRKAYQGIERADSVTIDPHKGLFLPYGLGTVLVKDVETMYKTHYYQANYMQDTVDTYVEPSPADLSPELTKHFRGMRMWLPLQLFGLDPFRAALEEKLLLCRYFYEKIQEMGFEVGPYPELSVCIYRYVPDNEAANEFNKKLMQSIHQDGRIFLSSTTIKGVVWIRLAVLCFRTHLNTIDQCLQMIQENRDRLLGE